MTLEDQVYLELKKIATDNNLELTDNAINIARFRARTGLAMDECPCERGKGIGRGCIGERCMAEINKHGICLCQCFRRKT